MATSLRPRLSIKAVIIREGRVLFTVNQDQWGEFLLLPGGGQRFGESMAQALQRECREELGVEIVIGDIIAARDYIGSHHEFAEYDAEMHQVEIFFSCELAPGEEPRFGDHPDDQGDWAQTGIDWVAPEDLEQRRVYPSALRAWLRVQADSGQRYLGDVN